MNGKPFSSQYAVHPHLRGAYAALPRQQLIFPGSSPPTWGIRSGLRVPGISGSVHPHLRGAYHKGSVICPLAYGSSPPTWGIREHGVDPILQGRFIPTYVGHTLSPSRIPRAMPVHPHLRGAYGIPARRRARLTGSSPPTWGILTGRAYAEFNKRFIPTYVGHTLDRRKKNGWFQPLFL